MSVAACSAEGASDTEPVDYAWPVTIVATYPASSAGYPVSVTLNGNVLATIQSPWVGAVNNCGVIGHAGFPAHQDKTDIVTFRYPSGKTTNVTLSPTATQIKNSGCMILQVPAP